MWIQGNRAKKSQLRRKDQQAVPIWAQVGARAKDAPPGWRVRGVFIYNYIYLFVGVEGTGEVSLITIYFSPIIFSDRGYLLSIHLVTAQPLA